MLRWFRNAIGLATLLTLATTLLVGCSTDSLPGRGEDATPTPETLAAATSTAATPLKIVTPTPFVATATTTGDQVATTPAENPAVYIVEENDTLYGIAVRFNVELGELISLNRLDDPNDIYIGQELQIPQK